MLSSDDEAGDDGLKGRAKVTAEVSDMQSDASQEALCEEDPDTQVQLFYVSISKTLRNKTLHVIFEHL